MSGQDGAEGITALQAVLGHQFENPKLLTAALSHPSLDRGESYQRLEFFGDRVLGLIIAEMLFHAFPGEREGGLTQRFHALVQEKTLAEVAGEMDLAPHILMSEGGEGTGGRTNPAILSDVVEAILGALYLDGGAAAARRVIEKFWSGRLSAETVPKDAKTTLQEWLQGRGFEVPLYEVVGRQGPDHAPRFTVRVGAGEQGFAEAEGPSRQAAEFEAAARLLAKLTGEEGA